MSSIDPSEFVCVDEYEYECLGRDISEMKVDESYPEPKDDMEDDIPF